MEERNEKTMDSAATNVNSVEGSSEESTEKPAKPSFKSRVRDVAVEYVHGFEDYFVKHEYLLCSEAFENAKYYTVQTYGTQYRHLLGVGPSMDAQTFYNKCMDGSLTEDDISFVKRNQTEAVVKGYTRRKIKCIPKLAGIFSDGARVEEDYQKNSIRCSFATEKESCTVGFTLSSPSRPMTLLSGDSLSHGKSKPLALVLRKGVDEEKYSEICVGDIEQLKKYGSAFKELLSDELLKIIEPVKEGNEAESHETEENDPSKNEGLMEDNGKVAETEKK